jgi:putative peptide zinc metalloprotease protein
MPMQTTLPIADVQSAEPAAGPPLRLLRNPAMAAHPFDSEARAAMVICEVPDADGEVVRFAIPSTLFELLDGFDGERDTDEVIRRFVVERPGLPHGQRDLARLVEQFLIPRRLLVRPDEEIIAASERTPWSKKSPLTFRFPLLSMRVVNLLAKPLAWLYAPVVVWPAVVLIVAAHVAFYGWIILMHPLSFGRLSGEQVVAAFGIAGLGMIAHELGHTTAAIRYGCRRVAIGWGVYLFLLVGYADLSEVWRLPRRQRAVVDVGGVYFQGLYVLGLVAVYLATGAMLPLYGFVLANATMAASVNPFLKLDGYWVLSDLTGIANLRAQSGDVLMGYWRRLWHPATSAGTAWPLSARATTILAVYAVVSFLFFANLSIHLARGLVWTLLHDYPQRLMALPQTLTSGPGAAVSGLMGMAMRTLILYGMLRFAHMIGRGIVKYARAAMQARGERGLGQGLGAELS